MLQGKVIMVTGSTGGMGRALCERLAEQGASLALAARKEEELAQLHRELEDKGCRVVSGVVDVTEEGQVRAFAEKAAAAFGKLDGLVNLAGLSITGKIWETEEAVYDRILDVNVKGAYLMCKHFVPIAAQDARIINIGSMAARRTNGNAPLYCVAKSAVNTLSQGLALQVAAQGIHVTTLNPGGADTPFWGDRPVKREKMLKAEDIVDVIEFVLNAHPRMAIHSIDFESISMV